MIKTKLHNSGYIGNCIKMSQSFLFSKMWRKRPFLINETFLYIGRIFVSGRSLTNTTDTNIGKKGVSVRQANTVDTFRITIAKLPEIVENPSIVDVTKGHLFLSLTWQSHMAPKICTLLPYLFRLLVKAEVCKFLVPYAYGFAKLD